MIAQYHAICTSTLQYLLVGAAERRAAAAHAGGALAHPRAVVREDTLVLQVVGRGAPAALRRLAGDVSVALRDERHLGGFVGRARAA